jgi:hypothetical protein
VNADVALNEPKVSMGQLEKDVKEIARHLLEMTRAPLPIGFIYTQLSPNPSPLALWPQLVWQDVSSQYAGQFFRAVGGNSAKFGTVQQEGTKRLTNVYRGEGFVSNNINGWRTIVPGQDSEYMWSGDNARTGYPNRVNMRFHVSNDEVRPRNQAVRIWKVVGYQ